MAPEFASRFSQQIFCLEIERDLSSVLKLSVPAAVLLLLLLLLLNDPHSTPVLLLSSRDETKEEEEEAHSTKTEEEGATGHSQGENS